MTITRTVTVAAGVFAPGHLGELTLIVPFRLVDAVLEENGGVERRVRDLPSRVGVYFLLAMCLFPEVGYGGVWGKLTAGLGEGFACVPTVKALRDLRRRIGVRSVKALFEVLAGPLAAPGLPGARFGRYRTVSFDGCTSQRVRDTARNRAWLGKQSGAGYPALELMTLVETGTRALLGAVFGPRAEGETGYATRLLHLLAADMLVLWDKGFDGNAFLAAVHDTGAKFLGRVKNSRRLPVLARLQDGSYLSSIDGLPVRIVEAVITVTCQDGTEVTGVYRLVTNLLNPRRHPAEALIRLYHQRWEHESAYYALRHTMLAGRVLRSGDRVGVEQEMWALLTTYQVLRTAMVEAVSTVPGTDPDRAGFTIALQCARDRLILAAGVVTDTADPAAGIGKAILAGLLPPRRLRISTRKVKSPLSRYSARNDDGRPLTSQNVTALHVCVHIPPAGPSDTPPPDPSPTGPAAEPTPTRTRLGRLNTILGLMRTDPTRLWAATDIAYRLGLDPHDTRTQLGRWSRKGLFRKTARATYTLP